MAKTGSERQAAYKVRARETGRQLNIWIDEETYHALRRIARSWKKSRKEVLEFLVLAKDAEIQKKCDDAEHAEYIKVT
jgi:hypothetical protein